MRAAVAMIHAVIVGGRECQRHDFPNGTRLYLASWNGDGSLREIPERCTRLRKQIDERIAAVEHEEPAGTIAGNVVPFKR